VWACLKSHSSPQKISKRTKKEKQKRVKLFLDTKLPKKIHEVQIIEINQYEKKRSLYSHRRLEDLASEEPALNDNLLLTHSIGKEVDKFLFSFMRPIFHL